MDLDDFDYDLPTDRIAQDAAEPRDSARLLLDRGPNRPPDDATVADLVDHVGPGTVVVVNNTRVRAARLALRRSTGGTAEVLLLSRRNGQWWEALVRPARKLRVGEVLAGAADATGEFGVEMGEDLGDGRRLVRLRGGETEEDVIERHGVAPLPPYLDDRRRDPRRYQTVYADRTGSAAAPTAGLHLTPELLGRLEAAGATVLDVELEVGLGTFRPMTAPVVEDHVMHAERYRIREAVWEAIGAADDVLAVGTTTTRALESAARLGTLEGSTELFLHRGCRFEVVDRMMTNFHLPKSSLLVMVDAFVGPRWRTLYRAGLDRGYRMLSFGDAMLLDGRAEGATK